jgi:hypothetical protein
VVGAGREWVVVQGGVVSGSTAGLSLAYGSASDEQCGGEGVVWMGVAVELLGLAGAPRLLLGRSCRC